MDELKNKLLAKINEKLDGDPSCSDLAYLADAYEKLDKDEWLKQLIKDSQNLSLSGFGGNAQLETKT